MKTIFSFQKRSIKREVRAGVYPLVAQFMVYDIKYCYSGFDHSPTQELCLSSEYPIGSTKYGILELVLIR